MKIPLNSTPPVSNPYLLKQTTTHHGTEQARQSTNNTQQITTYQQIYTKINENHATTQKPALQTKNYTYNYNEEPD
jgi:hypothetical protein